MGTAPSSEKPSAQETIDRLLDAAMRALDDDGESGFRVEQVIETAGASASSLYHHFGNRDGLIDAARAVAFSRQAAEDVETIRLALHGVSDREEFLARMDAITRLVASDDRAPVRRRRLAILGRAASRPELWEALQREQRAVTDGLAQVILDGQRSGLVRPELDARALAQFVLGYAFGRVLGDLDAEPLDAEERCRVIDLAVRSFVVGPPGSAG